MLTVFFFTFYKRFSATAFTRTGNSMIKGRQETIYIFLKNFKSDLFRFNGPYQSF